MIYKRICLNCGKEFETQSQRKKFCCKECCEIFESKVKYKNDNDVVVCHDCGFVGKSILNHIRARHGGIEDYCKRYGLIKYDLMSKSAHNNYSNSQKKLVAEGRSSCFTSENNPSKSIECKNGRNSPYSMNFRGYDGLSDEEKKTKIDELHNRLVNTMNTNHNNPLRLDYYTFRGLTEEEAQEALSQRQTTFSKEKCIEKYGEELGLEIWLSRQQKWQKTLSDKPLEEIRRINKSKGRSIKGRKSYSKISQDLFWKIYDQIKNDYRDVYFATLKKNDDRQNYEYMIEIDNNVFSLDFYVKDVNKVIEFDGTYWHEVMEGAKERDDFRQKILESKGFIIYRVKERDYNENPEKVIQECLEFLKS